MSVSKTKLIVLRGPSGSGKSSVARVVRLAIKTPTALIEQDYLRRVLLKEKDIPGGTNIELIKSVTLFALARSYHVILEGIFDKVRYSKMFAELLKSHPTNNHFFYFDVTFDETLRRHSLKSNRNEFGETEMRAWYKESDLLEIVAEEIVPEKNTIEETINQITEKIS